MGMVIVRGKTFDQLQELIKEVEVELTEAQANQLLIYLRHMREPDSVTVDDLSAAELLVIKLNDKRWEFVTERNNLRRH